jgi:hypothetical protein
MTSCTLLSLKGFVPVVAALLNLECADERLRLLSSLDAAPEQAYATDCISIDTLDKAGVGCRRTYTTPMGTFLPLYNETKGDRFLEMVSMQTAMNCQCTTFTSSAECDKCTKVTMMRQLGSPERTAILLLHEKRTKAARAVRAENAMLLAASDRTRTFYCKTYPGECQFVASLIAEASADPRKEYQADTVI